MKIHSRFPPLVVRLALALGGAVFFITSTGCQLKPDPGIEVLEHKLDEISDQFLDSHEQAGRLAAWQIAAALLIVAAGFALVGGAALGSSARRAASAFHQEEEQRNESDAIR